MDRLNTHVILTIDGTPAPNEKNQPTARLKPERNTLTRPSRTMPITMCKEFIFIDRNTHSCFKILYYSSSNCHKWRTKNMI